MVSSASDQKQHGTRKYAHNDIRTQFTYSQSALATSASLAWLYVGCLSVTFATACWVLQKLHPVSAAHWESFNEQVPDWVFTAQVSAFGAVLVLNIINLMFCSAPVQYNCNILLALIHGVAFATDFLLELRVTPVVLSWGGRLFVPLRYIQWTHTTPTMILLMAMMSNTSSSGVMTAVSADLVMVLTGLAATWTTGAPQLVCLTISLCAFAVVMLAIVDMFKGALAETQHEPAVHGLMEKMLWLTLLVWALFPLVWTLAWLGYVSLGTEQLFWGVSDYGAKVVFSSHLWQKNLATVQQRREAAQELLRQLDRGVLLERLRGLLAAKERLVHALQHELTTPIHGMMALVQELLHNKTQSTSSRTRMLLMIRSSAVCLLNTISTALSSSSGPDALPGHTSGSDSPHRRVHKVHLWRVAESVVRLTRPLMRDHVRILNCISRELPPVQGDSAKFMQVLMNLVCSSLKYTHSGAIKISAASSEAGVHVTVADTGAGIPAQQLQQALDPFELVEGHTGPGSTPPELWDVCRTGLGLYLVKQTLASMGSDLTASSEVGHGSSFEFDVPLADSDCESESEVDAELFSEPGSLRGSMELLAPPDPMSTLHLQHSSSGGTRDLQANSFTRAAAAAAASASASAAAGAGGANGFQALGAMLLSGAGEVGSAAGALDAAAAAAAGLGLKQNHRALHNGVIQVLSVDDDQVNQLVASTALRLHKWEVVKCMSGAEALEYLLHKCTVLPDLVLLDVMMPTMSGYEVATRIRDIYPSSLLPIIMVSAKTEEEDIVQGLRCGADDYVPKPFKRAELAARIRAHIRARDAFQQQQATEQQWMLQHNLLPLNVQRKLRNGETVIAESHPAATVLWAEVLGPTAAAASGLPSAVTSYSSSSNVLLPDALLQCVASQHEVAGAAADPGQPGDTSAGAAAAAAAAEDGQCVSRSGSALCLPGLEAGLPVCPGGFAPGLSPAEAVVRLNSLYTTWEELCAKQDVLGVDFSGSTFVAVSGHDDHPNHAELILRAATAMLAVAASTTHVDGSPLAVRLGIHTGPLTTGLVGSKAVKLVLMGDTVEGARQLAATGCPGAAHISSEVFAALTPPAAASPWTHQRLPGAPSKQQTYLLKTREELGAAVVAAAARSTAGARGSKTASAAKATSSQQQQPHDSGQPAAAVPEAGGNSSELAAGAAAAATAATAKPAGPATPDTVAAAPGAAPGSSAVPVSLGRVAAAAAAGAAGSGGGGGGGELESPPANIPSEHQQQQQQQMQQTQQISSDDEGQLVLPQLSLEQPGGAGSTASAPSNSSGQQQQQQPWQQSSLLSPTAARTRPTANSPPPARVAVATAVSSLAVNPSGPLDPAPLTCSSSKLGTAHEAGQSTAAATAATAATAAMVACLAGTSTSSDTPAGSAHSDAASLLALQQAGSNLINQLGAERRLLQEQLLLRTQQHAAAATELACVKQQLQQAGAAAEQRAQQVEALQQQVSALLVRAHLADCWQAIATMKAQVQGSLGRSTPGTTLSLGGAIPAPQLMNVQLMGQQQQLVQQQLLQQPAQPLQQQQGVQLVAQVHGAAPQWPVQTQAQEQQSLVPPSHHQALVPGPGVIGGAGAGFLGAYGNPQRQHSQQKHEPQ